MSKNNTGSTYKFKYVYLVLVLVFIISLLILHYLPHFFPSFFVSESWFIETNPNTGAQTIKHISENTAMQILQILKDIVVSGLVGVILYAFYEHRFENEEKQTLIDGVNNILSDTIELHVEKAILSSKDIQKHVLSDEFVDEILRNCLLKKTGDEAKSNALLNSVLKNVINFQNTVTDLDVTMNLSNFSDQEHKYSRYESYKMTYTIRYRVILNFDKLVFILTNSKQFQNNNLGAFIYCQFIDSSFSGEEVFFNVKEVTIDGIPLNRIGDRERQSTYVKEEYWNNECTSKIDQEVQVVYSVEFLLRKMANHYSYFTPFMTKGINLSFDANATDIKRIKLLPYFNSGEQPTIVPGIGTEDNPKRIAINLNDWVLPSSGVSFIWQFESK